MNHRYIVREVVCDGGCHRAEWADSESYDAVRRTARAMGWSCTKAGDFCPECAARAVEGSVPEDEQP